MRSFIRSEDGFTLAETLVAMLVFLVAVCGLWELMLRTEAGFAFAGSMGSTAARAEQMDRSIRKTVGAVAFPFWAGDAHVSISGSSTIIPYASGSKDTNVSLSYDGTTLTLSDGSSSTTFYGIESFDLEPLEGESASVLGISATYTIYKKSFSTRALFRSVSLVSGSKG